MITFDQTLDPDNWVEILGGNKTGVSSGESISERLPFGLDIDGANPVVMALAAWSVGSAMTADFVLNWEEFR